MGPSLHSKLGDKFKRVVWAVVCLGFYAVQRQSLHDGLSEDKQLLWR